MIFLRSLAAGFLLSSYFIMEFAVQFSRWYSSNAQTYAFHVAIRAVSPDMANAIGGDAYGATIFIFLCLGAGIFIGSTIYCWAESIVAQWFRDRALSKLHRNQQEARA